MILPKEPCASVTFAMDNITGRPWRRGRGSFELCDHQNPNQSHAQNFLRRMSDSTPYGKQKRRNMEQCITNKPRVLGDRLTARPPSLVRSRRGAFGGNHVPVRVCCHCLELVYATHHHGEIFLLRSKIFCGPTCEVLQSKARAANIFSLQDEHFR